MIVDRADGTLAVDALLDALPAPRPDIRAGAGVYRPSVDSALLCRHTVAETVGRSTPPHVVELCAGSGIASIYAASLGARVTAVDDRRCAVEAVADNAARNGVRVRTVLGDIRTWRTGDPADLVVANPPYVPAPPDADSSADGHAWNAGADGRAVLDPIIERGRDLLVPGGVLVLVYSAVAGVARTVDGLRARGFDVDVVDEVPLAFGPVMTERAAWLLDRGLIEPGQQTERLVVVRAVRTDRDRAPERR